MTITMTTDITHYVSLDLGSDSMAAYCEKVSTGEGQLIGLQEWTETHPNRDTLDLLRDNDANMQMAEGGAAVVGPLSKRLRTQIFLRDPVTSAHLPANHPDIEIVSANGQYIENHGSLFLPLAGFDTSNPIMPNPKLVFQTLCREAVPELAVASSSIRVRHDPAILLRDLTVQIINNFILRSSALREVPPRGIHLILTIPNVYSITHSRQIEDFVRLHCPVGAVSVIYESDALAYYVLDANAPPRTDRFRGDVIKSATRPEYLMLTIDIGRGTTDLSLIRIELAAAGSQQHRHTILARSGVTSGGQALTYLFVKYFDGQVKRVFDEARIKRPYDFTRPGGQYRFDQRKANRLLEQYIEVIKRSINEDYRIAWPKSPNELIEELVDHLLEKLEGTDRDVLHWPLQAALRPPTDLRNPSGMRKAWWKRLFAKLRRMPPAPDPQNEQYNQLVTDLDEYVRRNVDEMLSFLEQTARQREEQQLLKARWKSAVPWDRTFVIVAGQASQFKPIHAAITRWLTNKVSRQRIHFIENETVPDESKVACCKGAVGFLKAPVQHVNVDEFFGTFGFCAATMIGKSFIPVSTADLVRSGKATVNDLLLGLYHLVYVVRPVDGSYIPRLSDGYTAVIKDLQHPPSRVEIHYDRTQQRLTINGVDVDIVATTYGYVNTQMHPKIWPIVT